MNKITKVLEFLKILQYRIVGGGKFKNRERRVNPYNPLSYVFLVIAVLIAIINGSIVYFLQAMEELKTIFKYQ